MKHGTWKVTQKKYRTMNKVMQGIPVRHILLHMDTIIRQLDRQISNTSKWRMVKRYRLLEKLYRLENDKALIDHVMGDQNE